MVRSLAINKFRRLARESSTEKDVKALKPGHMRLFSFYKPSLQAGLYGIETTQVVTANTVEHHTETKTIQNLAAKNATSVQKQEFAVVAPQFSLDPKLINTFYPPAGHLDEAHILPHIVFNDPHVPWLRAASPKAAEPDETGKNFMPWLALMVFRPEDLAVDEKEAALLKLDQISSPTPGKLIYDRNKPPSSGAYPMTIGDFLTQVKSRVYYDVEGEKDGKADFDDLKQSAEPTSIIFPTRKLVNNVFGTADDTSPLDAHKFLAHVRQINTIGFPDAGVEEEGFYSVVISSMTGDVTETAPSTHVVHLVSLEHLDATFQHNKANPPGDKESTRIGLVSLFSWTYTCIPDAVSFPETMKALALSSQPLRPPKPNLDVLLASGKSGAKPLYDRMNAGYTISRWRGPTGEESIAFNRGPLTPVRAPDVPAQGKGLPAWPAFSMTGKDYLIFDKSLGMMDATYAAAWSMGKLMAISDSAFNAALMRLRSLVWTNAASATRLSKNGISGAQKVFDAMKSRVPAAVAMSNGEFTGTPSRVNIPAAQPLAPPLNDPLTQATMINNIAAAIRAAATAGDSLHNGVTDDAPNNSDFEIVANWIYDVMYLGHMPAHMIFPEPSHLLSHNPLPVKKGQTTFIPEALRFFHVDHAWIDCFIDGALSCANHHEPKSDWTRIAIKRIINDAMREPVGDTGLLPPIPRYGFILRSSAVKATPDLRLSVFKRVRGKDKDGKDIWTKDEDPKHCPLVRHTKLDDFTIFALLDCAPEEIYIIKFAQPPHQQRYAIPLNADTHIAEMKMKHLYSEPNSNLAPPYSPPRPDGKPQDSDPDDALMWRDVSIPDDQTGFFTKDTRCIHPAVIAKTINDRLIEWGVNKTDSSKSFYTNTIPDSVVLGLELNDPAYQLEISELPDIDIDWKPDPWIRKLWDGGPSNVPPPPPDPSTPHATPNHPPTKILPITLPDTTQNPSVPPAAFTNSTSIPYYTGKAIPFNRSPNTGTGHEYDIYSYTIPAQAAQAPQFELLVHPAYRPAPPRPQPATTAAGGRIQQPVFAAIDYIPTKTLRRFDLILAVRLRTRGVPPNPKIRLKTLYIEIPLYNKNDTANRETLLEASDDARTGVRMATNARFVPALFYGAASSHGIPKWDTKDVLVVALTPRSSGGTIAFSPGDAKTSALGVRLTSPTVSSIRQRDDGTSILEPVQIAHAQNAPPAEQTKAVAKVMVKMTELYDDGSSRFSWCTVLKTPPNSNRAYPDGRERDPWGNLV